MAEARKTAVRLGTSFECGDGLTFSYDREVESFRLSVGKLMVTVYLGQLLVQTTPEGHGSTVLLSVDARP